MSTLKYEITSRLKYDADFCSFVAELPKRFGEDGDTVYNKRNVIKIFDFKGQKIVVKRFKRLNFLQRPIYSFFRASKAERAYKNAAELIRRGVDTPEGLAFVEEWSCGTMTYGYFVSTADFANPIKDKLIDPEEFDKTMATDFASFCAILHQKGILHHDLNNTNVLYHQQTDGHYSFSVIDANRMDFYNAVPPTAKCYENLTRFTGRKDLFEFFANAYAHAMNGNVPQIVADLLEAKRRHDLSWQRRKAFTRKFKSLFGKTKS